MGRSSLFELAFGKHKVLFIKRVYTCAYLTIQLVFDADAYHTNLVVHHVTLKHKSDGVCFSLRCRSAGTQCTASPSDLLPLPYRCQELVTQRPSGRIVWVFWLK